jgi:hypothetical protein
MTAKLTIEDARRSAEEHGGQCGSKEYLGIHSNLNWQCASGHVWESSFARIRVGCWCPVCAGNKKHSIGDCHKTAMKNSGKCLSETYVNANQKMLWSCESGHVWESKYSHVLAGRWCAKCARERRRNGTKACHKLAKVHDGEYLSNSYTNSKDNIKWRCKNGHEWLASYSNVKAGKWCAKCRRKTIECCNELASKYGGTCLSKSYIGAHSHLEWMCKHGHKWMATYGNISKGTWCPSCKYKNQARLSEIIEAIFGIKPVQNVASFEWLRHKRNMQIDIYVKELRLAVEYDGEQHFIPVNYGGSISPIIKLKKRKAMDLIKDKKIREHIAEGGKDIKCFVRFNYKECITEQYVRQKLTDAGILERNK